LSVTEYHRNTHFVKICSGEKVKVKDICREKSYRKIENNHKTKKKKAGTLHKLEPQKRAMDSD